MNRDRMQVPSQSMEREQYLESIAEAEIQNAIRSVISGESGKAINRSEWTGFPDMTKCWKCGSTHLAAIENKFQDKTTVWCQDCGKTWLVRCFR